MEGTVSRRRFSEREDDLEMFFLRKLGRSPEPGVVPVAGETGVVIAGEAGVVAVVAGGVVGLRGGA